MAFRALLLMLTVAALPAVAKPCFLNKIEEIDQNTVGEACNILSDREQMALQACLLYINNGVIKSAGPGPYNFPVPLKQAREMCSGYGGVNITVIINKGPFSETLDQSLLAKLSQEQISKVNECVDKGECSGSAFKDAFAGGVDFPGAVRYATCVGAGDCSSSAFAWLFDRSHDFTASVHYSQCVAHGECSSNAFTVAYAKEPSVFRSLQYAQCVASSDCSSSAFETLLNHGASFYQSLEYSKCVASSGCSSNAMDWKIQNSQEFNFAEAMELSKCVAESKCSLSTYQKAYERLGQNHAQAMAMARE